MSDAVVGTVGIQPLPEYICKKVEYVHVPSGLIITEHEIVAQVSDDEVPDTFPRFTAVLIAHNLEGQPVMKETLVLGADTIEEAFALLPDVMEAAKARMQTKAEAAHKEANKPKIEVARDVPPMIQRALDGGIRQANSSRPGNHKKRRGQSR